MICPRLALASSRRASAFFRGDRSAPTLVGGSHIEINLPGRHLALVGDGVSFAFVVGRDPEADSVTLDLAFMYFDRRTAGPLDAAGHRAARALQMKLQFHRSTVQIERAFP